MSVSVLTLTAISLERYYAIVHPLRLRATPSRTRLTIVAIWLVSAALITPELIVLDTHRNLPLSIDSDLLTTCKPGWSYTQQAAYQIFLLAAVYLVPLGVMSVAYLRIGLTLWRGPVPSDQSAAAADTGNRCNHASTSSSSIIGVSSSISVNIFPPSASEISHALI